jgi:hypothetical protein
MPQERRVPGGRDAVHQVRMGKAAAALDEVIRHAQAQAYTDSVARPST